jgi:cation transport ATPase
VKGVNEVDERKKETRHWMNKVIWSAMLSIPMIAFMVYDFVPRLPYEKTIMPLSAIISLILATPVLFII